MMNMKGKKYDRFFVVSFKRTILVINEKRIKMLQNFLSKKEKLAILFLSETKKIFDDANNKFGDNKVKYEEIKNNEKLENEINEINFCFFRIKYQNFSDY